jgi:hypothetical protein
MALNTLGVADMNNVTFRNCIHRIPASQDLDVLTSVSVS